MTSNTTTELEKQICSMSTAPQQEHRWLEQLLGEWTFEGECTMGPDQPPWKSTGFENVRSLGGLWTVGEGSSEMPDGSAATTIMTLGFDTNTQRFVGTFVASMMGHLWLYDGELDDSGRVLTLYTDGPSMAPDATPGQMVRYKDVIEIEDNDRRTLTSYAHNADGSWTQFVKSQYRRKTSS